MLETRARTAQGNSQSKGKQTKQRKPLQTTRCVRSVVQKTSRILGLFQPEPRSRRSVIRILLIGQPTAAAFSSFYLRSFYCSSHQSAAPQTRDRTRFTRGFTRLLNLPVLPLQPSSLSPGLRPITMKVLESELSRCLVLFLQTPRHLRLRSSYLSLANLSM